MASNIFDKYLTTKDSTQSVKTQIKTKPVQFGNAKQSKPIDIEVDYSASLKRTEDGKPIFIVSQSLVKEITTKRFEIKKYCPWKVYTTYIIKSHRTIPTLPMLKGNYFEYLCLGSNAYEPVTDLPRALRPVGAKTTDQLRIEEQAVNFKRLCQQYGFVVTKDNVQKIYKKDYPHKYENECKVIIKGVVDFEHAIWYQNQFVDAVIDLKFTANLKSTFGDFSWGKPEFMDHIQFDVYNYLSNKPCVYWVFDCTKELNQDIFMHDPDETNIQDMHTRINLTIIELITSYHMGWEAIGEYENCKDCPHNPRNGGNCQNAINIKSV